MRFPMRWKSAAMAGVLLLGHGLARAQGTLADYQRGQALAEKSRGGGGDVPGAANWIGETDHFWYTRSVRGGTELGWGLVVGVFAIAGLPPLGIFTSEFLVVSSTFARQPWLALLLVFGLLLAFGALIRRLQGMAFGEPSPGDRRSTASTLPIAAHLGLVLLAGLYLPPPLVAWFQHVATMLR